MENGVTIIGSSGNMGTRYRLIFERFVPDVPIHCVDKHNLFDLDPSIAKSHKVIIATPTDSHVDILLDVLEKCHGRDVDVLCEKPIVKTDARLKQVLSWSTSSVNFYMVNNYAYTKRRGMADRWTRYHYFNSGTDGLIWDCIQIVHLAHKNLTLDRTRPIWLCQIDGKEVPRADVDNSYVRMIYDFMGHKRDLWGIDDFTQATIKCLNLIDEFGENPASLTTELK